MRYPRRLLLGSLAALLFATVSCNRGGPTLVGGTHTAGGHSVLFLGNSLTYTNDLPAVVAAIGAQAGDTIDAWYVANPDWAILEHVNSPASINAIKSYQWDFVVLQQGPTTLQINRDSLILWAKMIEPTIRSVGAEPALMMSWPDYSRTQFFDACRVSFQMAAQAVNGVFMPAGEAWRLAWLQNASIPLYSNDGFHPSQLGTYAAALEIFERITGRDVRSLPAIAVTAGGGKLNVSEATVRILQEAAHQANANFPAKSAAR